MKTEDMILISVDDHVVEPPEMFDNHMTKKELETIAPRMIEDGGKNFWLYEGNKIGNMGLNAVVGRPKEEYGMEPLRYQDMRKAVYSIDERIDDMNANGILSSLCFPTFPTFAGNLFHQSKDKKAALRVIEAYNDWHIDEWAAKHPGRIIPMALLPIWDSAAMVAEVKRVVAKGCRAISFPDNPSVNGFPSLHNAHWDDLWEICAAHDVVINCHIGTGAAPPHSSPETPIDAWISTFPMAIANSAADWLYGEFLHKYDNLKISLTEGGVGWVPYFLERSEFTLNHHGSWTKSHFHGKRPTEVFREHFLTCFIEDESGLRNRDLVGINNILFECDYPHSDCTWPYTPENTFRQLESANMTDAEINTVTHLNAIKYFNFDPIAILGRENCTVGALRAQAEADGVDTTSRSGGGRSATITDRSGRMTSGEVQKLFAGEGAAAAGE
ncbi:MAG: amidohydrolase family protein [Pseudomonadales bacterium]|nr:amidohydrolase family protein [Pseudomonadales bacterium]